MEGVDRSDMTTVIRIENLWKHYRLGVIGHGTLMQDIQSWWARVRGKEDPNSKIMPLLEGQENQVEEDSFWALRDVNLDVSQGEVVGIIGKNGAGKSTLLKILSRITKPTRGQAKFKGRLSSLLEVGTGFHAELTGRENIYLNGAVLGMSKKEIDRKINEIIDFSGVAQYIETPVKRYSSGMRVRLAFAVAAHLEPEILLVDEVLAVGDAEFQKKAIGKMHEVTRKGSRTILFVSHNMAAVENLCSRVCLLDCGRIVFNGDTKNGIQCYLNSSQASENAVVDRKYQEDESKLFQFIESWIENESGKKIHTVQSGQFIAIGIRYRSKLENQNIQIRMKIYSENNDKLTTLSNFFVNKQLRLKREGDFRFIIEKLPFPKGKYRYSLQAHLYSLGIMDKVEWAGVIDVSEGDYFGTGKIIKSFRGGLYIEHRFQED